MKAKTEKYTYLASVQGSPKLDFFYRAILQLSILKFPLMKVLQKMHRITKISMVHFLGTMNNLLRYSRMGQWWPDKMTLLSLEQFFQPHYYALLLATQLVSFYRTYIVFIWKSISVYIQNEQKHVCLAFSLQLSLALTVS